MCEVRATKRLPARRKRNSKPSRREVARKQRQQNWKFFCETLYPQSLQKYESKPLKYQLYKAVEFGINLGRSDKNATLQRALDDAKAILEGTKKGSFAIGKVCVSVK